MLTGSTSLSFLSPPAVFGTFFDPFSPLSWSLEQAIVIDSDSPFLQHFTYLIVVIYTFSWQ